MPLRYRHVFSLVLPLSQATRHASDVIAADTQLMIMPSPPLDTPRLSPLFCHAFHVADYAPVSFFFAMLDFSRANIFAACWLLRYHDAAATPPALASLILLPLRYERVAALPLSLRRALSRCFTPAFYAALLV